MKTRIFIAVIALSMGPGSVFAVSQPSSFRFLQKPGPFPVGLKVVDQYDRSRTYPAPSRYPSNIPVGETGRPLQTLIWYPSLKSTGEPMTVGDYIQLADTEIHFNTPDEKENRWRSLLKASFDIPLWAVREAKPAKRHYPVLVYAPSDSSVSWENADPREYFASHGYVVLEMRFIRSFSTYAFGRRATAVWEASIGAPMSLCSFSKTEPDLTEITFS